MAGRRGRRGLWPESGLPLDLRPAPAGFVTEADFAWAVEDAARRKKLDCSAAELLAVEEGLCVQMLHTGPFETEPETVRVMDAFLAENGYVNDLTDRRLHHEIYLSDVRKIVPDRWRTILRHPVRKISS